jgi:hypothetical protein
MYCFGRLFQSLVSADEVAVLAKVEKRYAPLENLLFILGLIFHPMYAKIGRAIVDCRWRRSRFYDAHDLGQHVWKPLSAQGNCRLCTGRAGSSNMVIGRWRLG